MSDKDLKEQEGKDEASGEEKSSKETDSSGAEGDEKKNLGDSDLFSLFEYLARSLGLREKPESILEEISLAGIAKYIASDKCKKVLTMAGAGISTSAGIPDFRSPGTGIYNQLASYDLPNPQAIFELDFFKKNPRPFYVLAKELYPGNFKPTLCHYFLKLLNDHGKLLRHYTQNIDTLERVAGLASDKIVEAHGTFHTSHCLTCNAEYTQEWMKGEIFANKVPHCIEEGCAGVVKPDIVFFGETLPKRFADCVASDMDKADLLIVMGTSLTVQPFASLTNRVPFKCPRLYINLEKGDQPKHPMSVLMHGGGFEFDSEDNYRDVFKGATCDAGCEELADLLGWGDELRKLVKEEHAKIDKQNAASVTAKTDKKNAAPPKASSPSGTKLQKPVVNKK